MEKFRSRLIGVLVTLALVAQVVLPGLSLAEAGKAPASPATQNGSASDAPKPGVGEVEAEWAETAFDVGSLILSLSDFKNDPSFWTGFWVLADSAPVVCPVIPALSTLKRGAVAAKEFIQQSPRLHYALKIGVMRLEVPSGVCRGAPAQKSVA